ncbi:hypothetical protein VP01_473g3 [Puccinia sorghi]|uniref:Uncharacterized protein n=1 Tax=Puccinia sorghi TaxID=27349 RepID=A0A0L6UMW5_9BASI|nr:hypothetical protein VP01_473g3 [Puccinia sorghi]
MEGMHIQMGIAGIEVGFFSWLVGGATPIPIGTIGAATPIPIGTIGFATPKTPRPLFGEVELCFGNITLLVCIEYDIFKRVFQISLKLNPAKFFYFILINPIPEFISQSTLIKSFCIIMEPVYFQSKNKIKKSSPSILAVKKTHKIIRSMSSLKICFTIFFQNSPQFLKKLVLHGNHLILFWRQAYKTLILCDLLKLFCELLYLLSLLLVPRLDSLKHMSLPPILSSTLTSYFDAPPSFLPSNSKPYPSAFCGNQLLCILLDFGESIPISYWHFEILIFQCLNKSIFSSPGAPGNSLSGGAIAGVPLSCLNCCLEPLWDSEGSMTCNQHLELRLNSGFLSAHILSPCLNQPPTPFYF